MKITITIRVVLVILLICLGINAAIVFATESGSVTTDVPSIVAESGILIDAKTGMVLYNKNMDVQKEPASTTKIITALLALEKLEMDRVITIDAETPFTEGSRIYLLEGEQVTVEQLMYGLLLESANDAAVALGKEMAGSVEAFAEMMNERAKELGAKNTNFINPNGLHEVGHMTTAYDLAMITKVAMENPEFRKFVSTYKYTIPATNKQETRYLYNTNRLLYDEKTKVSANGVIRQAKYEGTLGIKTGYTSHAGGCLVSGAERDGTELIAVVLKSTDPGRFGDSIALLDWGFENYQTVKTIEANTSKGTVKIKKGAEKEVSIKTEKAGYATLPIGVDAKTLTEVRKISEEVQAPIKAGQEMGTIDFFHGDMLVSSVKLIAASDMEVGGIFSIFKGSEKASKDGGFKVPTALGVVAGVFAVSFGGLLYIRNKNIKRRKKRRVERAMRLAMEREMDKLYYSRDKYMNR